MKIIKVLQPFVLRHWFKLGVVAVLLFFLLQKDFSFKVQFNAPVHQEQPNQSVREEKRSTLTENRSKQASVTDRLQLFGVGEKIKIENASSILQNVSVVAIQKFIDRFVHVAETEQEKYGVPASLTLANGLLMSYAGTRDLSQQTNNYFALPCTSDWQGPKETSNARCYRVYDNAWTSFRDHSLYLTTGAQSYLKNLGDKNFKAWAKELEKIGFGDEKDYGKQVLNLIDVYQLQQYD